MVSGFNRQTACAILGCACAGCVVQNSRELAVRVNYCSAQYFPCSSENIRVFGFSVERTHKDSYLTQFSLLKMGKGRSSGRKWELVEEACPGKIGMLCDMDKLEV